MSAPVWEKCSFKAPTGSDSYRLEKSQAQADACANNVGRHCLVLNAALRPILAPANTASKDKIHPTAYCLYMAVVQKLGSMNAAKIPNALLKMGTYHALFGYFLQIKKHKMAIRIPVLTAAIQSPTCMPSMMNFSSGYPMENKKIVESTTVIIVSTQAGISDKNDFFIFFARWVDYFNTIAWQGNCPRVRVDSKY